MEKMEEGYRLCTSYEFEVEFRQKSGIVINLSPIFSK